MGDDVEKRSDDEPEENPKAGGQGYQSVPVQSVMPSTSASAGPSQV